MRRFYSSSFCLRLIFAGILSLLAGSTVAQIKIGNNGTNISPASLLELESTDRGLLIPRMANTTAIDALNPPEGMLIYRTTAPAGLYVRKATQWEYLTGFASGNAFFNNVTVSGAVTAGSFSGPLTGNASTATLAATATNSDNSAVTNDISSPAVTYPVFVNATPGYQALRTSSANLSYIPSTGILTARGFAGPLTGNVTGNATSSVDAQNTVNMRITDDQTTPTTMYPTFVGGITGPLPAHVSSTRLSFVPLTGELTAPIFRGNLLGNATSATTVTGVVNAPNGGTGQTIYTPGDILFADASNTLAKLPIGIQGTILRVDATNRPSWSTAGAGTVTNVTGTANRISVVDPTVEPIIDIDANYAGQASITTLGTVTTGTWNGSVVGSTYGGTGRNTLALNEIVVGGGAGNPVNTISLVGTANKVLTSNGPNALPTFETAGVGDMVLAVDQTVNGIKRFNDGTLILKGSGTGITTLRSDANANGAITLPGGTRTLVSLDGTETLVNKTLTAPNMTGTGNFQTLSGTQLILGAGTPLTTTNQTGTAGSIVMSSNPTIVSPTFTGTVTAGAITSTGTITATLFDGPAFTANNTGSGANARTAAVIASAVDLANQSTELATPNTIVRRDNSGNFSAGTITATLNGIANNVSQTVGINHGGTGQITANAGFNALSPMTTPGDIIYGGVAGAGTRLAIGSGSQVLKGGVGAPVWGTVALGTDISGVLPAGNGGTGVINTQTLTFAGAGNVTLTAGGATTLTLPTTGTLATTSNTLNNFASTTSAQLATVISDETGVGGVVVFSNSPTLVTPNLGAATATSMNGVTITAPANAATLTLANNSILTTTGAGFSTTLNVSGNTSVNLPTTGTLIAGITSPLTALNFPSVPDGGNDVQTITVNGAALSDPVSIGLPNAVMGVGGLAFQAWVSNANEVSIRFTNNSGGNLEPDGNYKVTVFK